MRYESMTQDTMLDGILVWHDYSFAMRTLN